MLSVGALAFLNPWLLAALAALPALWLLLRAIPPSPRRLGFPGVRLLLGLIDPERTPVRTPWWLLVLRCLIAAAAVLAFADPVLNPTARLSGQGPLLIAMDAGWASAPDWEARRARALEVLGQAERAGRPVVFAALARPVPPAAPLDIRPATDWRGEIEALQPAPWAPMRAGFEARVLRDDAGIRETVWITDGLAHDAGETLADTLAGLGHLTVIGAARPAPALRAPVLRDGRLSTTALRADPQQARTLGVTAFGTDDEAGPRRLGQAEAVFAPGEAAADAVFDLPLELRNRVDWVAIAGSDSAGAVGLADDAVRRRRAGLVSGGSDGEAQRLVSDLHYLRTALRGAAEVVEGDLTDILSRAPDVIFLADVGRFTDAEAAGLLDWTESGGLLVRFAGPRLARGTDALSARDTGGGAGARAGDDPLLPVRLRAGGRSVGGAMAWGSPQKVRAFDSESPFRGLPTPADVTVSRQILAELGPDLPQRTWAALEDGTPLVTAARVGAGRVVLFHVTANADWSSLPLSGLFVGMVGRLVQIAGGAGGPVDRAALPDVPARPIALLDGFGRLVEATDAAGAPPGRFDAPPGPDAPPGLYAVGEVVVAFNLHGRDATLSAAPPPPASAVRETLGTSGEMPLAAWFVGAAVLMLALDTLASLALSGRLPRLSRPARAAAVLLTVGLGVGAGPRADAQALARAADDAAALRATIETVLAYVVTGDAQVDLLSRGGLEGLGRILAARTAIEPGSPVGVNLETDELAFFPVLYWPITPDQPTLSDAAIARLNTYMRTGGMVVFDTRDRHLDIGAGSAPNAEALRRLAARLDLPPLAPVPADHVLTRTFYLLDAFPGRWTGGRVWVEAGREDTAEALDGAPFRNANDGVSPVIVGANDWAAAWAVDARGEFLAPIGGGDGWRQREMAYRFGVNLVMYALTGNYKSDQVHVPALLERLGQ